MVLFVGYQAAGTTGRKIFDGAKHVTLFNEDISVQAEIGFLPGKSGHADRDGLLRWLDGVSPRPAVVFVNHGDDGATTAFVNTLRDERGYVAHAPYSGTVYDLAAGQCTYKAEPRPIAPEQEHEPEAERHGRKPKTFAPSEAYLRLVQAGEALQKLIRKLEGAPNKTLRALAEALESLVEKYR